MRKKKNIFYLEQRSLSHKKGANRVVGFVLSLMLSSTLFGNAGLMIKESLPSFEPAVSADATFASVASATDAVDLQKEGVVRPEDLDEGLSRKSFEDMEGRRVTLREPYMEVTSREVARQEVVGTLDDTFQFIDPTTGDFYDGPAKEIAKVDFVQDGKEGNEIGNKTNPRYPMRGLANSKDNSPKIFSDFEKYMLLRQAWYYRKKINTMLENHQLGDFLKKHPAAEGIYGAIDAGAKAVSKTIISDPIYNSPLTTGLYLAPGEVVTVTVSELKSGETVKLTTHQQDSLGYDGGFPDGFKAEEYFSAEQYKIYKTLNSTEKYFMYWDSELIKEAERAQTAHTKPDYTKFSFKLQGQWQWQNQKVPCMGSVFEFAHNGTYEIGSIYGGPLYLQPTNSVVKLEITGAVETPHFILGVTTKEEFDKHLKTAPGLIATLDVENGQLIGLADYMRNCDDIEKLAYFWHSVFAINSSLNGREYNYNITMAYDIHVPAGEAVALNSSFAAQPFGWFEACMNYKTLTTKGNWGTFHELGHIQAKTYGVNWGMCGSNCKNPCEGEVWNNTLIILMYSMLCNMDPRVIQVEHGEYVHPYTAINASMNLPDVQDYHDYNNTNNPHFPQLSLYSTLIHSFGPERFIDFFYTYKVNPSYCNNARADFIYRIGLVDHVNILEWINRNYHGNVNAHTDFSAEQLEFLNTLPTFYPIAYEWANGIDGNETARKYDVDGKYDTIFDLSPKSFVSYKPFTIIEVTNPVHGTIEYKEEEQKAIYTPPTEITENDEFSIVVSTEGGRIVTLNVRMRLVYNGAHIEMFKLDSNTPVQDITNIIASQKDKDPFRTEESAIAGKASFNSKEKEYYHIQFSFKATKAGLHKFTVCGDDAKICYFKKDNEYITNGQGGIKYSNPNSYVAYNATDNNFASATLQVGDIVDIDFHLVNWAGAGYAKVGVVFPDATAVVDIPAENIVNTRVSSQDLEQTQKFEGWQPKFLDSIKDETVDYVEEKENWQVLKYPEFQANDGQGVGALLDGKKETYFHSKYSPSKVALPHEFVIDCRKNISANYFDIVRRENGNDRITEIALYGAADNGKEGIPEENEFFRLFEGPIENPNVGTYRITFDEQEIRFFKLIVKKNQDQTVIRELTAGRAVELGQTVKPKNFEKGQSGFEENKSNGKLSTQTQNAFYQFEFLGSGFDVFADTDRDYGTAEVFLDDSKIGEINLSDKPLFNKCVFRKRDLDVKNHVVKIVTTSNKKFNISFINVNYETPVDKEDYPAEANDFGDESPLTFSTNWRTLIKDYKNLTRIDFVKSIPEGYVDTYLRMNKYIHVYQKQNDENKIAFVYAGKILAPSDASSLFAGCTSLQEINFENFDTSNMLFATSMFNGCAAIQQLDLSGFNTQKVLYLSTLLENCENLQELNLSGFAIKDAAQVANLLRGCHNLAILHVPNVMENGIQLPFHFLDPELGKRATVVSAENAGHTLLIHEAHPNLKHCDYVPATRNTDGIVEHDECIDCGAVLLDGVEVEQGKVVIRATGYLDIIIPCVAGAVIAVGGVATVMAIRKKKKKKQYNK